MALSENGLTAADVDAVMLADEASDPVYHYGFH